MLQEGHRLKQQGVDVVVGVVETHGRADTAALIDGLEQVPRRRIEYRGVTLEEMDLDALLRRKPTVALVDELAHTNAPDSRNAKRYQDVEELLRAGINVITTVNIQHLESLYDMIEGFTGVKVKERVPDYILAEADQIVNVDVSSEDLQERLQGGKGLSGRARRERPDQLLQGGQPEPAARTGLRGDRPPARPPPADRRGGRPAERRRPRDGLPEFAQSQRRTCCSARGRGWPTGCTPPGTPSTSAPRPRASTASTPPRSARSPTRRRWPTNSAPCP